MDSIVWERILEILKGMGMAMAAAAVAYLANIFGLIGPDNVPQPLFEGSPNANEIVAAEKHAYGMGILWTVIITIVGHIARKLIWGGK